MQDVVRDSRVGGELEALYREHGRRLWRAVRAYSGDPEVASDAVAEAFTQALGRGDEVRSALAWIWKTAFRVAAGELKARRRHAELPVDPVEAPVFEAQELLSSLQALSLMHGARSFCTTTAATHPERSPASWARPQPPFASTCTEDASGFGRSWRRRMADIRQRFGALDRLPAPEFEELMGRGPRHPRRGDRGTRALTVGIALVLSAAGVWLAVRAFSGVSSDRPGSEGSGEVLLSSALDGEGDMDLYVMNEDGSGLRQLTDLRWHEVGEWSPGGTKVAFTRWGARNGNVYVINADGSGLRQLTDLESMNLSGGGTSWSPDGSRILLEGAPYEEPTPKCSPPCRPLGLDGIYVIDADGTGLHGLTTGSFPSWSPDGSRIDFLRGIGEGSLYTIEADGSNERRITPPDVVVSDLSGRSWSPDGTRIAFGTFQFPLLASPAEESCELRSFLDCRYVEVVDIETGEVTRLTEGSDPLWSPDGQRIAFARQDGLYVMDADGSNIVQLHEERGSIRKPLNLGMSWSPDSKRIAFSASRGGTDGPLHIINVDGTGLRTFVPGSMEATPECCVVWRPVSDQTA